MEAHELALLDRDKASLDAFEEIYYARGTQARAVVQPDETLFVAFFLLKVSDTLELLSSDEGEAEDEASDRKEELHMFQEGFGGDLEPVDTGSGGYDFVHQPDRGRMTIEEA